jgi:hypothetical protein
MVDKCEVFTIIKSNYNNDMNIDIRSNKCLYVTIGQKMFYIDDSTDEAIIESWNVCRVCGTALGMDCGDAEPDYNDEYCSEGCYKSKDLTFYDEEL